jgi:hypothetical protein
VTTSPDQETAVDHPAVVEQLQTQLRAEQESNLMLHESVADLQLALEDRGWESLSQSVADEFTPAGRKKVAALCRMMAISHPLIKRGLAVRIGYIWGQGVEIRAKADGDAVQDVNAVVQAFIDDNGKTVFGSQAQEELERALGTDGGIYLAAFTSPLTGRVQVRSTPTDEIVDIITNPEDRDEPWFYIREYVERVLEAGYTPGSTRTRGQRVRVAHPALGYRPVQKIKTLDGAVVRWDAPVLHVPVNRLDGWKYGVPDVYASLAWARMYRDFLVDWAGLTKALSKFAWRATGSSGGRAARAAAALQARPTPATAATAAAAPPGLPGPRDSVGQVAAMGPGNTLEAIPKSGAHIDAESGKPLAAMVAAGIGLPVTILLADPGQTGARAVAETLDLPTLLEMGMRRLLWQDKLGQLIDYTIDQAVLAPQGALRGTLSRDDWGRFVVTLAGNVERTVEWDWPALIDLDPVKLVAAIVDADSTGKLPPLTTVRLLLAALGVKDIDEVIEKMTDDNGDFIDPRASAGQAAVDAFRAGQDPAGAT